MADWYTKEEAEASPDFGSVPEKRDIEELLNNGLVLVDKPFGPVSNQVSSWIRKELNREKAGHFGTLDPNATGVLPVGLDNGTRMQKALAEASKEYVYEAEFRDQIDEEKAREVIKGFEGTNNQIPPEKSAVKREEREREVYRSELIEIEGKKILGRVKCESGFYVRVLVDQIAEKLDTEGSMNELRRTQQGDIEEDELNTIQEIVDAYHFYKEDNDQEALRGVLYPKEKAVNALKKVVIKDSAVNAVANGSNLGCGGISKLQDGISEGERIAIMTLKGELVAIAKAEMTSETMYHSEGTAADLESVHMDPETYPKRWKN